VVIAFPYCILAPCRVSGQYHLVRRRTAAVRSEYSLPSGRRNCRDSSAPKERGPQNDMGLALSSPNDRSSTRSISVASLRGNVDDQELPIRLPRTPGGSESLAERVRARH